MQLIRDLGDFMCGRGERPGLGRKGDRHLAGPDGIFLQRQAADLVPLGSACRWLAKRVEAGGELVPFRQIRREVGADLGKRAQVGVARIELGIRKLVCIGRKLLRFRSAERVDFRHEGRVDRRARRPPPAEPPQAAIEIEAAPSRAAVRTGKNLILFAP